MERVGLVGYVEEQLERAIAQGRLPRSGQFGSEQKLARSYGVSRSTVREALRRLSARGLVVQHPGRKTRAVALDESLTLENVGLALHDERSADGVRLLEGYFALKRQVLVELLADCCANASKAAVDMLGNACFALWDAVPWASGARCTQLEFDLLRLAARVADRPGHLLLIQSLQRGLPGLCARGVPLMDCESLRQWACCAMNALHERDARTLEHELPTLLRACDERVLERFAPAFKGSAGLEAHRAETRKPGGRASATEEDDSLEGHSTIEERGLGRPAPAVEVDDSPEGYSYSTMEERGLGCLAPATAVDDSLERHSTIETRAPSGPASATEVDDSLEGHSAIEERGLGRPAPTTAVDDSPEGYSTMEERGLGCLAPVAEGGDALTAAPRPHVEALLMEPDDGALSRATLGLNPSEPRGECVREDLPVAALTHSSDCRTGWCAPPAEGNLPPERPPTGTDGPPRVAVREDGGPLHGTRGNHPLTTGPACRAPLAPPPRTPQDHLPREQQWPVAPASPMKVDTPSPEE